MALLILSSGFLLLCGLYAGFVFGRKSRRKMYWGRFTSRIVLLIQSDEDGEPVIVRMVTKSRRKDADPIEYLVPSAEFLTHIACQKSHAGYEKALELISQGAMDWS